jgi:bifunctional NMN adenylyltransferase/nudix hydrolase
LKNEDEMKTDIGVMVGRFQTPELHDAHHQLLKQVASNHKKVILFLGVPCTAITRRNPLDFTTRKLMIQEAYPDFTILPIRDCAYDEEWSKHIDQTIREIYPFGTVTLYGGRDSFIAHYKGGFPCEELESKHFISATEVRRQVSNEARRTRDFRAGVIYAAYNQFPRVVSTVDIAPLREMNGEIQVLLAKKPGEQGWRFIGGHVDPSDVNLEMAARRETGEEANIDIEGLRYIGSFRIEDWRYTNEVDRIVTTFFAATYVSGAVQPQDDISELRWVQVSGNPNHCMHSLGIEPAHIPLANRLVEYLMDQAKEKRISCVTATS